MDQWRLNRLLADLHMELQDENRAKYYFKNSERLLKDRNLAPTNPIEEKTRSYIREYKLGSKLDEQEKLNFWLWLAILSLAVFSSIIYALNKKKDAEKKQQEKLQERTERQFQEKLTNIFEEIRENYIDDKEQTNRHLHDDICPGIVNIQREIEYYLTVKDKKDYDLADAIKLCQLNYDKLKGLIDRDIEKRRADVQWLWYISLMIRQQERNNNFKIDAYLDKENLKSISPAIGHHLARITCVLVENVERSSNATEMSYSLVGGKEIILAIEDNGIGFDKKKLQEKQKSKNASIGLLNVDSRVKQMKGRMDIDTAPNQGTKITITIPNEIN